MKSEHLADLEASGISQDTAIEAGLHSCDSKQLAEKLGFPVAALQLWRWIFQSQVIPSDDIQ